MQGTKEMEKSQEKTKKWLTVNITEERSSKLKGAADLLGINKTDLINLFADNLDLFITMMEEAKKKTRQEMLNELHKRSEEDSQETPVSPIQQSIMAPEDNLEDLFG